ncbi:MAG: penicillin-insensitive murein endopeptidase [Alphaproteobacteria bacterium]|nr:penicillin-insensitive murein endopeptidase [Alphaproteobacteria bacterium]
MLKLILSLALVLFSWTAVSAEPAGTTTKAAVATAKKAKPARKPVPKGPPAKELFAAASTPAPLAARAIGAYSKGCLSGGVPLSLNGPNWQVMRLARNRNWGHPRLIDYLERLASDARALDGWPGLLVGDLSQPRGGPMLTGHTSHQIGLDGDIWLTPMPDRTLSWQEREDVEALSMLKDPFSVDPNVFTIQQVKLIKRAASYPELERIFVHPAIKKALCEQAPSIGNERAWLGKVRPWWNHHYHFHVRLSCPPGVAGCDNQKPVLGDDGCGQELKNWYEMLRKSAIWQAEQQVKLDTVKPDTVKPDTKPAPKKKAMTLADLPKDCSTVIAAGGNKPVVAASADAMPVALTAAANSKEAGPPVPVLDPDALKALRSGKPVTALSNVAMPLPERNPVR